MAANAKKVGLPDITVDTPVMVTEARACVEARTKVTEYTNVEKKHSSTLSELASSKRKEEANKDNYIGIVRVNEKDIPLVRIEMRMEGGALDVEEEENLNALYGATRTLLFQREKVVNEILDPMALIEELKNNGLNPFDYLDLKVRVGMDHILTPYQQIVTSSEAFLPKEGFLNTLNEINNTLSEDAKTYTRAYLDGSLKPRVVHETKSK